MENINFLYSIALWLSGFLSKFQVKLHSTPPPPPSQDLLQKEIRSSKSVYIPRWVTAATEDVLIDLINNIYELLQILLSAWQAAAHNCHGARYTRHLVGLRQLSQQSGYQGWAAAHPQAMRTALLLAHAGDDLLPSSQHGSRRTSAFCWVLETVSHQQITPNGCY